MHRPDFCQKNKAASRVRKEGWYARTTVYYYGESAGYAQRLHEQ